MVVILQDPWSNHYRIHYVIKKIVHPALEVYIGSLVATYEGIDNSSIFSRVMIATE